MDEKQGNANARLFKLAIILSAFLLRLYLSVIQQHCVGQQRYNLSHGKHFRKWNTGLNYRSSCERRQCWIALGNEELSQSGPAFGAIIDHIFKLRDCKQFNVHKFHGLE